MQSACQLVTHQQSQLFPQRPTILVFVGSIWERGFVRFVPDLRRQMWIKQLVYKSHWYHQSFLMGLAGNPGWHVVSVPKLLKYQLFCCISHAFDPQSDSVSVGSWMFTRLWATGQYFLFLHKYWTVRETISCRTFLKFTVSLRLSSEIAGMGRVQAAHVSLFPSVTFVFYLAIRGFPTLGLTVIRETS